MKISEQFIGLLIMSIAYFIVIRWINLGFIRYQLNNSAYKKRKKGMSCKEWFFYSRYKEEVPKVFRVLYFVVAFGHPLAILVWAFLVFVSPFPKAGEYLVRGVAGFDLVWCLLYSILFWSFSGREPYSRWIKKKRGTLPKKKR